MQSLLAVCAPVDSERKSTTPRVAPKQRTPVQSFDSFMADLFPWDVFDAPKAWEERVATHLHSLGYLSSEAAAVLAHCNRYGSAQCAPHLSEADMDAIERHLSDVPVGEWERYPDMWTVSV